MQMGTLAKREGFSRKYLHALLTALKSAGLVRSVRGAGGGFVLARHPSEIRLSEILSALEGSLALVDCIAEEETCDRTSRCTARRVWQKLNRTIEDALDGVTLEDLIAPHDAVGIEPERDSRQSSRREESTRTKPSDG